MGGIGCCEMCEASFYLEGNKYINRGKRLLSLFGGK